MQLIFLAFIIIPIIEMVILIEVGALIGALPTVGLVLLTAIIGVWLLRMEGLATFNRVQQKLNAGQIPETELLEGIMLLVGGALLLTPGFFTDTIGFVCLIPFFRRPLAGYLIRRWVIRFKTQGFQQYQQPNSKVMEGEFTDLSDGKKNPPNQIPPQ